MRIARGGVRVWKCECELFTVRTVRGDFVCGSVSGSDLRCALRGMYLTLAYVCMTVCVCVCMYAYVCVRMYAFVYIVCA